MPPSHSRIASSDDGYSSGAGSKANGKTEKQSSRRYGKVELSSESGSSLLRKPPPVAAAAELPSFDLSKAPLARPPLGPARSASRAKMVEVVVEDMTIDLSGMAAAAEADGVLSPRAQVAGCTFWQVVMWVLVLCFWKYIRMLSWLLNKQQYCCRPISISIYYLSDRMDKHMPTLRGLWIWLWGTCSLALHFADIIVQFGTIALLYTNGHRIYALVIAGLHVFSQYLMAVVMYMEMDRIAGQRYKGGDVVCFIQRLIDVLFWDVQLAASVIHANLMIDGTTQMQLHGYEEARITMHALVNTLPACIILGVVYGAVPVWVDLGEIQGNITSNFRSQVYAALALSVLNALDKWLRAAFLCDPSIHPPSGDGYPLLYMRSNAGRLPYALIQDFLFRCNKQLNEEDGKMTLRLLYDHYHFNNKGNAKELCDGHKAYLLRKALRTFNGTNRFNRAENIARRLDKSKFKRSRTIRHLDFEAVMPEERLVAMMAEVLASSHGFDRLTLTKNALGDTRLRQIVSALRTNAVVELNHLLLAHNDIGADGASALAVYLANAPHLATLDLSDNVLGDEGVRSIAEAMSLNTTLYRLDMTSCGVGPDGASALGVMLRTNTGLRELVLASTRIGSAGADAIAKCLRQNATLRQLDLSKTTLDDRAAGALAGMLGANKALNTVNLSYTRIGDVGGKALCDALHQNNNIQVLDVSHTPMDPSWRRLLQNVISGRVK